MAHIKTRQLKPGKDGKPRKAYQVRWIDAAGKQRSRQFGRMTDAKPFKTEIERALMLGTYVDPRAGDITLRAYAEQWRAGRIDHRANTAARVKRELECYVYKQIGGLRLGAARRGDLQQWVSGLVHTHDLAPVTVRGVVATVGAVFARAVEDGLIARNPCKGLALPEVAIAEVVIPTDKQLAEILGALMSPWYRRLVITAAGTGMRSGELRGITEDRVDWLRRTVKVDRQLLDVRAGAPVWGPPKTAAGYRTIPVAQCVIDVMAEQIAQRKSGPEGLIFTGRTGKPLSASAANQALSRALDPLGWPEATGYHLFRHYYASLLIHRGLSVKVVQKRLGHATVKETLDTYGHLWPESDDDTRTAVTETLGAIIIERPWEAQASPSQGLKSSPSQSLSGRNMSQG